jgi:hypothetical protein
VDLEPKQKRRFSNNSVPFMWTAAHVTMRQRFTVPLRMRYNRNSNQNNTTPNKNNNNNEKKRRPAPK